MPRRYRSSRRIVVRKQKWSPHFKSFSMANGDYLRSLVDNSSSTATPTPSVIKVKHVRLEADVQLLGTPTQSSAAIVFILFIPEGWNPNTYQSLGAYVEAHPEYILGWSAVQFPSGTEDVQGMDRVVINSHVARNCNSGDKVCIALLSNIQCYINGGCSFVTCTN